MALYHVVPLHNAWTSSGTEMMAVRTAQQAADGVAEELNRVERDGYTLVTILASGSLVSPLAIFVQNPTSV